MFVLFIGSIAVLLLGTMGGYIFGRRVGLREGNQQMSEKLPILLRAHALVLAHCPICDANPISGSHATIYEECGSEN